MKPVESIDGLVEQRNDSGIRVKGQWFNQSKFRHVLLPEVGQLVRVSVDVKGFIVDIEHLDGATPAVLRPDNAAVRLAVLQIAAGFASTRPEARSVDVLPLADAWLKWINENPDG